MGYSSPLDMEESGELWYVLNLSQIEISIREISVWNDGSSLNLTDIQLKKAFIWMKFPMHLGFFQKILLKLVCTNFLIKEAEVWA